ncbi:FAD-dependent oxidoreductase [Candidatus Burkholderia verschuerenii]|uniref:FAD-dependent oxidoreductase n=1 Tax=Candidatus Burkholderia verschuerenii TaxID=242163 RepID=UPI000A462920|nr:FAD-dependent oxidoreductase [Candidatus Burkholderia verschuerenii]
MSDTSYSADVVIVGAGVAGSLAAHELASSGLSVLVLDAGPRVTRGEIVENFRNSPATTRALTTPYPPKPWALAPFYDEAGNALDYLQVDGPDGYAYQTDDMRLVGGTTWHWAGCAWRHLPNDFRLKSQYGVGRDWPIGYDDLEPYYYRAEMEMGVCGPDPSRGGEDLGSPRKQPYPMDKMLLTPPVAHSPKPSPSTRTIASCTSRKRAIRVPTMAVRPARATTTACRSARSARCTTACRAS